MTKLLLILLLFLGTFYTPLFASVQHGFGPASAYAQDDDDQGEDDDDQGEDEDEQ
jgi:hypothetical protein